MSRLSSIQGRLQCKVFFHSMGVFQPRSSFIQGCFPSKVIFYPRLSSIQGVFHPRLSSFQDHLPSKVIFHPGSSSIQGRLPTKVIFHPRLSTIQGCLPSKQNNSNISCMALLSLYLLGGNNTQNIPEWIMELLKIIISIQGD